MTLATSFLTFGSFCAIGAGIATMIKIGNDYYKSHTMRIVTNTITENATVISEGLAKSGAIALGAGLLALIF